MRGILVSGLPPVNPRQRRTSDERRGQPWQSGSCGARPVASDIAPILPGNFSVVSGSALFESDEVPWSGIFACR